MEFFREPKSSMSRARKRGAPRWKRRKQARPEELLNAARELFVERGFAATRLEDIAAKAGVSKATLYLYFANKEKLLEAVVQHGMPSAIADAEEHVERFGGDSGQLLRAVVQRLLTTLGDTLPSGVAKLILAESGNFPELARSYFAEVRKIYDLLARILERGVRRGEFREVDVDLTVRTLMGPLVLMPLLRHSLDPTERAPSTSRRSVGSARDIDSGITLLLEGLQIRGGLERKR